MSVRKTRSGKTYLTPDINQHKREMFDSKKSSFTRSARKRLGLLSQVSDLEKSTLTEPSVLEEIFKLSPVSPIKRYKENIKPNPATCRGLLSPLRALTLDSPTSKKYDVIRKNILQNKLNTVLSGSNLLKPKQDISPKNCDLIENGALKTLIKSPVKTSPVKIKAVSPEKTSPKRSHTNHLSPSPTKRSKISESLPRSLKKRKSPKENLTCRRSLIEKDDNKENISPDKNAVVVNEDNILKSHQPKHLERGSVYSKIKHALHNSVPKTLVGRDLELGDIKSFIDDCSELHKAGSLYISGAPGTGKSACLTHVLAEMKSKNKFSNIIAINCMSMRTAATIYQRVASNMGASSKHTKSSKMSLKYIEHQLSSDGPMILLWLDEMDQLDSKHQEVLYTMFGWTSLENSRIILIGIANSLDLTDRILPRLQANVAYKPKLINFQPYSKDQLVKILQARIIRATVSESGTYVDPMAVQFCARKVAAMAGDARKALDVCRRAVEMVETTALKSTSPKKDQKVQPEKVGISQISKIMSGVYQSASISSAPSIDGSCEDSFPMQQKLVVCTMVLLCRQSKAKEVTLGKLHETYSGVCKGKQVSSVSQSEFFSLCELVESRGILSLKKAKQIRMTKIKLNMQEKDVEFALKGKTLLASILQNGIRK